MMMCDLGMECPIGAMTQMRKRGKEHESTEIQILPLRKSGKQSTEIHVLINQDQQEMLMPPVILGGKACTQILQVQTHPILQFQVN